MGGGRCSHRGTGMQVEAMASMGGLWGAEGKRDREIPWGGSVGGVYRGPQVVGGALGGQGDSGGPQGAPVGGGGASTQRRSGRSGAAGRRGAGARCRRRWCAGGGARARRRQPGAGAAGGPPPRSAVPGARATTPAGATWGRRSCGSRAPLARAGSRSRTAPCAQTRPGATPAGAAAASLRGQGQEGIRQAPAPPSQNAPGGGQVLTLQPLGGEVHVNGVAPVGHVVQLGLVHLRLPLRQP